MSSIDSKVAKQMLDLGILDRFQYQAVQDRLGNKGGRFHLLVMKLGYVSEEQTLMTLSRVSKKAVVSLSKMPADANAISRLEGEFCRTHMVFPCALRDVGKTLWLAMADPFDQDLIRLAGKLSGLKIRALIGRPSEITLFIEKAYGKNNQEIKKSFLDGDRQVIEKTDGDDFQIVDMSGNTLVRHAGEQHDWLEEADFSGEKQRSTDPLQKSEESRRHTKIEERLERIATNQKKAALIIKALVRLAMEKGVFSEEEFDHLRKT
jgi:hypothetical protein